MNPSPEQIYVNALQYKLALFNKSRRQTKTPEISHAKFVKLKYNMTVYQYLNRKFDRLRYYKRWATYGNNLAVE